MTRRHCHHRHLHHLYLTASTTSTSPSTSTSASPLVQSPRYIARMDVFYKRTAPIFPKDLPGPYKGRVAPALPRNGGALVEKLLASKSKGTEQPILLSGGSVGADTLAGAAALKAGHEVAHLYAACNEFWLSEDVRANQGGNVFLLSDELLDSAPVMAAFEKCAPPPGVSRLFSASASK